MEIKPQSSGRFDGLESLAVLAVLSFVGGAAAGLFGAGFRLALEQADLLREATIVRLHGAGVAGLLLVMAVCRSGRRTGRVDRSPLRAVRVRKWDSAC